LRQGEDVKKVKVPNVIFVITSGAKICQNNLKIVELFFPQEGFLGECLDNPLSAAQHVAAEGQHITTHNTNLQCTLRWKRLVGLFQRMDHKNVVQGLAICHPLVVVRFPTTALRLL
jgi:hypothetical protein